MSAGAWCALGGLGGFLVGFFLAAVLGARRLAEAEDRAFRWKLAATAVKAHPRAVQP